MRFFMHWVLIFTAVLFAEMGAWYLQWSIQLRVLSQGVNELSSSFSSSQSRPKSAPLTYDEQLERQTAAYGEALRRSVGLSSDSSGSSSRPASASSSSPSAPAPLPSGGVSAWKSVPSGCSQVKLPNGSFSLDCSSSRRNLPPSLDDYQVSSGLSDMCVNRIQGEDGREYCLDYK
jgi:hypothetical protein